MIKKIISSLWFQFIVTIFTIMFITNFLLAWLIYFLYMKDIIFNDEVGIFETIFGTLIPSVLIGLVILLIVGKKILKPITMLSKATKAVAKGDFSIRLDIKHRVTEIEEMAASFNKMVKELESIETLRNDFIVNVSHEFKTPLAAIEGYAMLLKDKELSEAEENEYSEAILESSRRLSTLCGNILKISNLENQGIIAGKKSIHLDEQIRQALLLLELSWSKKNIDLDIMLDNVRFEGNEGLMMQIWLNLLENAIKFTPENGIIRITLKKSGNEIIVTVADSGIGMSPEVQEHIFEKFYQEDKSRYSEGSGLGLTLVKRIIDLCEGTIEVQSEQEKGASFTVKLPVSELQ